MKVTGSAVLGIDRERVWSALQNPAVLVRTIPGCERLEETGPGVYRMTVTAGVASVKGVYRGEVALLDPQAPHRFVLRARGQGAPGTVEATVEIRLSEVEDGTRVDYDAEAVVGGMIGGVGQRVLGSVAKRTAGDFFSAVETHLSGTPVPAPEAVPALGAAPEEVHEAATGEPARVFERPAVRHRENGPAWPVLAAFGMGAGVALGSAVIGWLLGRTGRGR
ncbi:carbon monoxide dehydrogenase subunit G [Streptosporangium sp. NPDC000239]|uniref:SRPBCC family protein n=1 Tax=Streptosporangium sp. NPDC000239 TaxID=3154248 RepID=UPI003334703D